MKDTSRGGGTPALLIFYFLRCPYSVRGTLAFRGGETEAGRAHDFYPRSLDLPCGSLAGESIQVCLSCNRAANNGRYRGQNGWAVPQGKRLCLGGLGLPDNSLVAWQAHQALPVSSVPHQEGGQFWGPYQPQEQLRACSANQAVLWFSLCPPHPCLRLLPPRLI